jgi:uncharacterized protein (DUF2267 family)
MGFRELVKKVADYSGFSDQESQQALERMVEALAERLTIEEATDFASQLPPELQEIVLSAQPLQDRKAKENLLQEFMDKHQIDEGHAKKQIFAAWKALRDQLSPGEIEDMKAQLPNAVVEFLKQAGSK